ncbi:AfsR/SARP family transcriptional regulator [Micromonospora carbonacea]|uniref:Tetratricopeptide repeat-containing protein n=1 Tax=Micromonospora carbonacea TaxID=47853 RepID=A0A1C4Z1E2_9ACTN|nr:tetratricopeptide repeat protein [Micromonospora carbonacea]SCF26716.1 Tetratricopeptide repeat-containing protein [Micromonospora carbonacea]
MEFTILGPTGLTVGGRAIPLGAAKQRGLLAVLLYHAGDPVRVETIVEFLWQDSAVHARRPLLYTLASRLRSTLRLVGLQDALVRVPGTGAYRLAVDPELVDYHRFLRLTVEARQAIDRHQHDRGIALLTRAIEMWRDDPLADLRGARCEHLRRDMREKQFRAEKLLAESELATGRHERALARIEPLLIENALDEGLARLWAAALHAAGRTHDARDFVAAYRRRYRRAMRTDPALDLAALETAAPARSQPAAADTAVPMPRQLPNDVPDYTGHAALLDDLDALAAGDGIAKAVVLTGMPGVGKTTLAGHWGHRRRGWFPDGQLYLNAEAHGPAPPVRPQEALHRFLVALGVPAERVPAEAERRLDLYHRLMSGRRMLVVLDNVVDSDQARQLLPRSEASFTVVISRNRLPGLSVRHGIRSLTVAPLSHLERQRMLGRIIGARRTGAEPAALEMLARLSGGLPLALRVIGEHVSSRPDRRLGDLADELAGRLLDVEGDDTDEMTLRTVFAWSVNALDPMPARLFLALGLFPGSTIGAEAAAAMLAVDVAGAERALDRLARAHLVDHDTVRRYRMHDLLRQYAADRAEEDVPPEQRRAALRRLLDWYLHTAVTAVGLLAPGRPAVPDLPEPGGVTPMTFASDCAALRWCEVERPNLLTLVHRAAAEGFHRHAWQIVDTVHEVFDRSGDQEDMREMLQIALDAATADGHGLGRAGTLANLGASYFTAHDYHRAGRLFTEALRLAREHGYAELQRACQHNLASIQLRTGATRTAIDSFHEVLIDCRAVGEAPGEAYALYHLGEAHRQLGDRDEAGAFYRRALAVWDRIGSLRQRGLLHVRLAELSLEAGQPEVALAQGRVALGLHDRVTDDIIRCDALIISAEAQLRLGRHRDALADAALARAVGDELADPLRQARALVVSAEALSAVGDHDGALVRGREALGLLDDTDHPQRQAVRDRLAMYHDHPGRREERSA